MKDIDLATLDLALQGLATEITGALDTIEKHLHAVFISGEHAAANSGYMIAPIQRYLHTELAERASLLYEQAKNFSDLVSIPSVIEHIVTLKISLG